MRSVGICEDGRPQCFGLEYVSSPKRMPTTRPTRDARRSLDPRHPGGRRVARLHCKAHLAPSRRSLWMSDSTARRVSSGSVGHSSISFRRSGHSESCVPICVPPSFSVSPTGKTTGFKSRWEYLGSDPRASATLGLPRLFLCAENRGEPLYQASPYVAWYWHMTSLLMPLALAKVGCCVTTFGAQA